MSSSEIKTEEKPTITFNDKTYILEALPQDVQEFIAIHKLWHDELNQQRREVFKLEAALRGLLTEIDVRIKAFELSKSPPST